MTDHEMALKIGNHIARLQQDVSALQAVLGQYLLVTPGSKREIPQVSHEDGGTSEQGRSLAEAIAREKDASALIQALYRELVEEV
jgi:hypothetical protein